MSNLDVSLRLKLINQISGPANAAEKDLKDIEQAARRLNGVKAGDRLARDLNRVGAAARTADKHMADLSRHTRAMGGGGRMGTALAMGQEAGSALGVPPIALGMGMGGASLAAGAITGGIVATGMALKASVREAIQFEDAMAEVKKAVDMPAKDFADLERVILKLSRTTPLAKEEIAALVAQAGFAGRPAQDLVRFATFGAKAAKAFGMSAEDTGDALAQLANTWKLNQDGIEDMGDIINTLGDNTASKERDIVSFLMAVADAPRVFGLAKHEAAAFGATLLSLGAAPAVAGTGFKFLLSSLQTATKQNKEFKKGLKTIGLNPKQVEKMIRADPLKALLLVLERIDKVDPAKKMDVLTALGGREYFDDLARLVGGLEDLKKALAGVQDQGARRGSVEKSFKIFDELTSSKLKKMGNSFAALGVHIGNWLTPAIALFADKVGGAIDKLNDLIERSNKAVETGDLVLDNGLFIPESERNKPEPKPPHPLIEASRRTAELEAQIAAMDNAPQTGAPGQKHAAFMLRTLLEQAKAEMVAAMQMPGAAEAAGEAMQAVKRAIESQGEGAVQSAQSIAERIKALFNFTATPTISPQFAPSGGGDGMPPPGAPLPKPRPRASLGGRSFAQSNSFHITGGDPEATAAAIERRLARLGNSSSALFDTA